NGFMVLLVELPLTRLTQRYDARRVMCLGYALIGIGFAMNAWSAGLVGLFIGMTVFTFGETLALPMVSTWVAHLAPEPMRGRYIGALSTSWAGASMIGPAIGLQVVGLHPTVLWSRSAAVGGGENDRPGDRPPGVVVPPDCAVNRLCRIGRLWRAHHGALGRYLLATRCGHRARSCARAGGVKISP